MGNDGQAGRERAPWERLEGEPAAAYARFLVYRNLGPTRTLQRAWEAHLQAGRRGRGGRNRTKSDAEPATHRSSTWAANAVAFQWSERAREWDIAMLSQVGAEAVVDFVNILRLYAARTLEALNDGGAIKPDGFGQITAAVNTLGALIPAETVEAVQSIAGSGGVPGVGGQPGAKRDNE